MVLVLVICVSSVALGGATDQTRIEWIRSCQSPVWQDHETHRQERGKAVSRPDDKMPDTWERFQRFAMEIEQLADNRRAESDALREVFCEAVEAGDQARIKDLIDQPGDLAHYWVTWAVMEDREELLAALLDAGYDARQWVDVDSSELMSDLVGFAVQLASLDCLDTLFDHGLGVEDLSKPDESPLALAAAFGDLDTVLFLLERGATLLFDSRCPAVEAAAANGHIDLVEHLLTDTVRQAVGEATAQRWLAAADEAAEDYEQRHDALQTIEAPMLDALLEAIAEGDLDAIQALVDQGAPVDAFFVTGTSPLHDAAEVSGAALRLLTPRATSIDRPDIEGLTPLWHAVTHGDTDAVQWLLDNGADVNARDRSGRSLIVAAAEAGRTDPANLLLQRGAEVDDPADLLNRIEQGLLDQLAAFQAKTRILLAAPTADNKRKLGQMQTLAAEMREFIQSQNPLSQFKRTDSGQVKGEK